MSDQPSTEDQSEPQEGEDKVFDADYVDKLRKEAARYRTEAKSNSDAAKRLAQIEEAQKSEAEKVADRIAKAEAEVAALPAKVSDALRAYWIETEQIDAEKAELYLTGTTPELITKQFKGLVADSDKRKKNYVPKEGASNSQPGQSEEAAFVRDLFGTG